MDKDIYAFPGPSSLYHNGMTLRDWFAGQAIALCPNILADPDAAAKQCYDYAEAMIKERKARTPLA